MSLLSRYPTRRIIHPRLFWTDPVVAATATWLYSAAWCVVSAAIVLADKKSWRSVGRPATTPCRAAQASKPPARHSAGVEAPHLLGEYDRLAAARRSPPPFDYVRAPGLLRRRGTC